MSAIPFPDLVDDRADVLESKGLNGLKLALVALPAGPNPGHADVDLRFFNALHLGAIVADPSSYYVNIYTTEFPDGALRGQLPG